MRARTILLGLLLPPLCCAVAVPMQAQPATQQQTLQQYVAALQNSPNDTALRGKIIALAQTMNPPPAVPADVYELVGRAAYAIKNANTDADFLAAADAYGKALQLTPWVADYYFNQGVAYEKAKYFDEAIADLNWYLMAAPNAKDANEVRERIGGLKYAKEQLARQQQEAIQRQQDAQQAAEAERRRQADAAEQQRREKEDFARSVDGARFVYHQWTTYGDGYQGYDTEYLDVRGHSVYWSRIAARGHVVPNDQNVLMFTFDGHSLHGVGSWKSIDDGTISEDGSTMTFEHEKWVFQRQR